MRIEEAPIDFDFEFSYEKGSPATYDYPGDGPFINITKVWMNGVQIPLAAVPEHVQEDMIMKVLEEYQ